MLLLSWLNLYSEKIHSSRAKHNICSHNLLSCKSYLLHQIQFLLIVFSKITMYLYVALSIRSEIPLRCKRLTEKYWETTQEQNCTEGHQSSPIPDLFLSALSYTYSFVFSTACSRTKPIHSSADFSRRGPGESCSYNLLAVGRNPSSSHH